MEQTNILVVFANPSGSNKLLLSKEDKIIKECVKLSKYRENINLDTRHAATIHDVRRALLEKEYRIVHFSGHGTGQGLAFEDDEGNVSLIPQSALAELLAAYSPPLEGVILNACYSDMQGQLISLGVPYSIGMNAPISDEGAIEFTRGFYDALGAGKNIDFAYQEGCRTIKLTGKPDDNIPILFTKTEVGLPISASTINTRYEDRVLVEFAIRLIPKANFHPEGLLGKDERGYVFVGDYIEQQHRTLREILGNLWIGDAFDRVFNSNTEWTAIIFEVGELNYRKLDLMPGTWKSMYRIVSDPKRLGKIEPPSEDKELMGTGPRDYYSDDQNLWYNKLTNYLPHTYLSSYFGIEWFCYSGRGITRGIVPSRIFLVKNVLLTTLDYKFQDLGTPHDGIILE